MSTTDTTIFIIGAGVGGITFAVGLRRQFPGFADFKICEKAPDLGGTWRANTYPGCASDVPIMFFTHSASLSPKWRGTHGLQPEILGYWDDLTTKYDIRRCISFNTAVTSATWDDNAKVWSIATKDSCGEEHTTRAKVLVSAAGFLEIPRMPDIPGLDTFKGAMFHSGNWDHSINLTGKRVAVIGYGASAAQLVPELLKDSSTDIVQFCRTPSWFLWNLRSPYSRIQRFLFKWLPFTKRLERVMRFWLMELLYWIVFSGTVGNSLYRRFSTYYIKNRAPKMYHNLLIPTYKPGCKRLIVNAGYLESLHRPNMRMNWDGIDSIVEDGIVTKKGDKLRFDVIIPSTGFAAAEYPLPVRGLDGLPLQKYFDSHGGPTAFRGTMIPGFPNLFVLGGPNTLTGHTSVIFTEEVQTNFALKLIKPIMQGRVASVDVTEAATDAWNARLQKRMKGSVFMDCVSWYRVGQTGKVHATFPGSAVLFWWWMRKVDVRDFRVVDVDG
ncbi:FAD/NAD(P)-binding domain-containing protein [Hymenopellis radicata]|nr:FAD/NAD(P)-binding domain-containing protein [Hymenopellis radicata]